MDFNGIKEFINSLVGDNILSFVGVIVSTASLIFAYVVFRKNRKNQKTKILRSWKTSFNVINTTNNQYDNLKILYDNEELKNFTSSIVELENEGTEVIRRSDIAKLAPLKLSLDSNYRIIEYRMLEKPNDTSSFELTQKGNEIIIDFDFIESDEKFKILILHTGLKSTDLKIEGKVIGATLDLEDKNLDEKFDDLLASRKLTYGKYGCFMFALFAIVAPLSYLISQVSENSYLKYLLLAVMAYLLYKFGRIVLGIIKERKKYGPQAKELDDSLRRGVMDLFKKVTQEKKMRIKIKKDK